MKRRKRLKPIYLLLAYILLLHSCKHDTAGLLVRKWKVKDNSINISFNKNHTYELTSGSEREEGKWRLTGADKTIVIIHENNSDSERSVIKKITPDSLILKTRNGIQVLTAE